MGKLQAVVRQRNGTILFEARTDEQIEKILKTEQIAGLQVEVTTHPTLNLCKGVVNHEDFATENEDELLSFFKSYGVTEVYRIRRKENGKEIPTSTLILTFNLPSLPEMLAVVIITFACGSMCRTPCAALSVRGSVIHNKGAWP